MFLLTVRSGPVLHVWRDGQSVAEIPLTRLAALTLMQDLLRALRSNLTADKKD